MRCTTGLLLAAAAARHGMAWQIMDGGMAAAQYRSRISRSSSRPASVAASALRCALLQRSSSAHIPHADNTLLNPEVHLYRNVYFRGPLLPSIWLPPGLLTGRKYSAGTHWSTCARSHGQAVPGSMGAGAAAPVHGSHCLQPCSGCVCV
eukprot:SAG25_NODE_131_length_14413_cov_29.573984_1_plen_149_part_00